MLSRLNLTFFRNRPKKKLLALKKLMLHRLSFWSIPMWAVAGTSLEWACVVPIFLHRPTWHSNFNQNQPRACFKYFLFWWIFSNSHHKALSHGTSTLETPSSCVTAPESFKQKKSISWYFYFATASILGIYPTNAGFRCQPVHRLCSVHCRLEEVHSSQIGEEEQEKQEKKEEEQEGQEKKE